MAGIPEETSGVDGLSLLPIEAWERILDNLEDSKDIQNVFEAYPTLEVQLYRNKYKWLVDQVIPFLRPWLTNTELLACREVSKRWCRGVDNYLVNLLRVYDHNCLTTGQVWYPETTQQHEKQNYHGSYDLVTIKFRTRWFRPIIEAFDGRNMSNHHPSCFGRSFQFWESYQDEDVPVQERVDDFWSRSVSVLRLFGRRIWFLMVVSEETKESVAFCQFIMEALHLLPNLKQLTITKFGEFKDSAEADEFMERQRNHLPPLPHLESLEFDIWKNLPAGLVHELVLCYSSQVRRLIMGYPYWKREYSNMFPNMSEFTLRDIGQYSEISKDEVTELLLSLDVPKLSYLNLDIIYKGEPVIGNDIVAWLTLFPRLLSFRLDLYSRDPNQDGISAEMPLPTNIIPSLKSFEVNGKINKMNLDFLKCFPSLEYLHILGSPELEYFKKRNLHYDPKLWGMMPKLREVLWEHRGVVEGPTFFRTKHEYLQKQKERSRIEASNTPDLIDLFDCFIFENISYKE